MARERPRSQDLHTGALREPQRRRHSSSRHGSFMVCSRKRPDSTSRRSARGSDTRAGAFEPRWRVRRRSLPGSDHLARRRGRFIDDRCDGFSLCPVAWSEFHRLQWPPGTNPVRCRSFREQVLFREAGLTLTRQSHKQKRAVAA